MGNLLQKLISDPDRYSYKIIFFSLAMQCIRHHIYKLAPENLSSFINGTTPHSKIFVNTQLCFWSAYMYATGVHHGKNVVDFHVTVKALEPYTVHTSLSEFIFALKCGLLSIFRATSNLSSSTPDTIFCQSLMHRSFRVVKRSNTSPTVC